MTDGLKSYRAYKLPNVDWLGETPEHWDVRRLKFLLKEKDSRSMDGSGQLLSVSQYSGVTERKPIGDGDETDTRAVSLIGYKRVEPNELVVNIMLAWNGSMGVSQYPGIASPAYCVYRFGKNANPWYFHYLLRTPIYKGRIKAVSTGVVESRLRLYTDDLYRLEGLLPPISDQSGIVRFLDYIERLIHRYIQTKQNLLQLLEEKKQAIIHQAVTGQIDVRTGEPYPNYKSSGEDWLGDVPKHWKVIPLKYSTTCSSGDQIPSDAVTTDPFPEHLHPIHVIGGNGRMGYSMRANITSPIVAIGRVGALCGNVHVISPPAWVTDNALILRVDQTVYQLRFLANLLRIRNLNELANRSAQPLITGTQIRDLKLTRPPLHEQAAIVQYLETTTADLDTIVSSNVRQIELIQEYRTRLVSDVVTGKVDVREAVSNLPNDTE